MEERKACKTQIRYELVHSTWEELQAKSIAVIDISFGKTQFDSQELLVLSQLSGCEWRETGMSLSQKRKIITNEC